MITLYIDIDGTVIFTGESQCNEFTVAKNCLEFLQFCTKNFNCKWLSFHTKSGLIDDVYQLFIEATNCDILSQEWKDVLDKIEPVRWQTRKTNGINFTEDFFWLDDDVDCVDLIVMARHGILDSVIPVYINDLPYDLFRVQLILHDILGGYEE